MHAKNFDDHLEELFRQGASTADIARRADVRMSQSAVYGRLRRSGAIERAKARRSAQARMFALQRQQGATLAAIAAAAGPHCTVEIVRTMLIEAGEISHYTPRTDIPDVSPGQLRRMYEQEGMTIREIRDALPSRVSYGLVRARLAAEGTRFRTQGGRRGVSAA